MFKSIVIGVVAFFVVVAGASAAGWGQPLWAAEPQPLVPGKVYRTGSPLVWELLDTVGDALPGGEILKGGGAVQWTGSEFVPADRSQVTAPVCHRCVTINGVQMRTYTLAEAQELQNAVDWSTVENKQRTTVPICNADQRLWVTLVADAEIGVRNVYSCR